MTEIAKGFYELDPYVRDQFAELAVPEEEVRINEVVAIDSLVAWNIADQLLHLNALQIEIERLKQENQSLEAEEELLNGQHAQIDRLLNLAKGLLTATRLVDPETKGVRSILAAIQDAEEAALRPRKPLLEIMETDLDGDDLKGTSDDSFKKIIIAIEPIAKAVRQAGMHEPIRISQEALFLCKTQGLDGIDWIEEIISAYKDLLPQMRGYLDKLKQLKQQKLRSLEHAADFFNDKQDLLKKAKEFQKEEIEKWLPNARAISLSDGEVI